MVIVVALLGGPLWLAFARAQWSSSRSSSGLVNAGPAAVTTPTPLNISVDLKPGSDPNSTNLDSRGAIPVAILTTPDFDAADVDRDTVLFEGASPLQHGRSVEDVDEDGDLDLIMHFRTRETDIAEDATEACLTGQTFDGLPIQGCDIIRIVPPGLDSDGDGFGDAVEATLVTDQLAACPTSPAHDAWPADLDNSARVDVVDALMFAPVILSNLGDDAYNPRLNLDAAGGIGIVDMLLLGPVILESCTNP
ncbi:MAG: hypothetical protein A2W34_07520 [Chloroflexi bacterium RBG_16_64_32]|nr:MAG: hypothetical protein A2W34_07520 [Chloroflexi bacterium RBG_16_64_32]